MGNLNSNQKTFPNSKPNRNAFAKFVNRKIALKAKANASNKTKYTSTITKK